MRQGHRSRTSDWVAALRALYSQAPADLAVVDDAAAERLLPASLRVAVRALSLTPSTARLAHLGLGMLSWGLSWGVPLRTAAVDEAVRQGVGRGLRQLVLLGAGLDARAWRLPELDEVIVFEVDHPDTQNYKHARIANLTPLAREVRFCAADFEREHLDAVLGREGFDATRPSLWVWEGVTMYLTPSAIGTTLEAIARLAAPTSSLVMSYLPAGYATPLLRAVTSSIAQLIAEPVRGPLEPAALHRRLEGLGWEIVRDESAIDWALRYWPREVHRVRTLERLCSAVRRERGAS